MAEILVLRLAAGDDAPCEWIVVDRDGGRHGAPGRGDLGQAAAAAAGCRVTVLVPGADVLTTSAELPVKAGARLQQALPYALEEAVAADVENMHFAAGARRDDGRLPVAAVSRERLDGWLERLRGAGIHAQRIVPEQYGVPVIPGTASMLIEDARILVNDGAGRELAMQDLGPVEVLELLGLLDGDGEATAAGSARARHLLVYCDEASAERYRHEWNALRQELDDVDVKLLPDGALPRLAATVASGRGVDLLQGRYGPRTEFRSLVAPWRHAAMLLLAVLVVATGTKAVKQVVLSRDAAALSEAFHSRYRQLVPEAPAVEDPLRLVASLRARAGGGSGAEQLLLRSLQQLGSAIGASAERSETRIEAISFRSDIVDIRLSAPSVTVLDEIRRRIDESGTFTARIQSTDQDGERVSSRMQIRVAGA